MGAVTQVRRVLAVDRRLRSAARLLDARLWSPAHAEQAAEHLGHARWALLERESRAGDAGDGTGTRDAADAGDAVRGWEQRRRAVQSAELARLLSRFAVRNGVAVPPTGSVRLILLEDAWRLGGPLDHRPASRARNELLACPVVAYGSRPHAWMVFAAPAVTTVPAWQVGGRELLTDLGIALGAGDRCLWRRFAALLERGVPGRTALRAARSGAT